MFAALVSEGVAILVVRGEDGVLRAFGDTCRHHDPYVVAERDAPRRHAAAAFACPFAGWPGGHRTGPGPVRPFPVAEGHGIVLARPGGAPLDAARSIPEATAEALDRLDLDRYECTAAVREVRPHAWHAVADELASPAGALTVAGHAVVVPGSGRPDGELELLRVFPIGDGRTVVDRRRYRVRA